MPNLQRTGTGPTRRGRRFKVKATGEVGTGLSSTNGISNVGRYATIGLEMNVTVIDLCMDETGEIRTFRLDYLEELTE